MPKYKCWGARLAFAKASMAALLARRTREVSPDFRAAARRTSPGEFQNPYTKEFFSALRVIETFCAWNALVITFY